MNIVDDLKIERPIILSVVIPCYNEEHTLKDCVKRLLSIAIKNLELEVIIVDDHSSDHSYSIAIDLEKKYSEIKTVRHEFNSGKGAALRTGFKMATGDFMAVQDADLEYDPKDIKRLLIPLVQNNADVVLGSRFLSYGAHRALYFWHYVGNRLLTLLSNIFTDLNISDMETCYKIFRSEIIQSIEIKEERFGFGPEIVAKIAQMRVRIFEMGISYYGRTYAEGKKIGIKDGFRALYCIFRYSANRAPIPIQFLLYLFIGGLAALVNYFIFLILFFFRVDVDIALPTAFIIAAIVNYILCISILFRHKARWNLKTELFIYSGIVFLLGLLDFGIAKIFLSLDNPSTIAKLFASVPVLILSFIGLRFIIFPETSTGPWIRQKTTPLHD